jgi:hypothetical protein
MADQNFIYYALLFAAVLTIPLLRLAAKQLAQLAHTPGHGTSVVVNLNPHTLDP